MTEITAIAKAKKLFAEDVLKDLQLQNSVFVARDEERNYFDWEEDNWIVYFKTTFRYLDYPPLEVSIAVRVNCETGEAEVWD